MADRPLIPATEALLDGWHDWPRPTLHGCYLGLRVRPQWAWFVDASEPIAAHRVVDVAREVYGVDLFALLDQPAALAEAWRGLVGGAS